MKKVLLLSTILLSSLLTFAQGVLTGTITDAESGQALEGASVFAQNTTLGTVSKKDGSYRLGIGKGGYELVVSYTGYESKRMNVEGTSDQQLNFALKKEDKSMAEVVIQSSNEVTDGWEKYGSFFIDHFLGSTDNARQAKLENPSGLKFFFYKRSNKLKVLATEPLRITNPALGYNLQYNLDSFVYYYKTDIQSYRGNCLFLPMEGDAAKQAAWKKARDKAYFGSRLHFIRAYYDSTLKEDGFTVDLLDEANATKFNPVANPYDTSYYFFDDSTNNAELWFPRKVSITYLKGRPEPRYLEQMGLPKNVPIQVSYVELKDGILLKPNGYFTEQRSWVNEGYWSWKNVADMLPYDYNP